MTKVYVPLSSEGFEFCHPKCDADFEIFKNEINGARRTESWVPVEMQLVQEEDGVTLHESDSPWLGAHALIFREAAVEIFGPILESSGELLPLACRGVNLVVFNPTRVLAALDEASSSISRFSDGRIMRISKYVFFPEAIEGVDVFKLTNLRVSPTFVSEKFVDLWMSSRLRGLEFREISSHSSTAA